MKSKSEALFYPQHSSINPQLQQYSGPFSLPAVAGEYFRSWLHRLVKRFGSRGKWTVAL